MLNFYCYFSIFQFLLTSYTVVVFFFSFCILFVPHAVFAVLSLIVVFLFVSFLFILLGMEYLGLVYIIVYVGAIAILFLFVIMLLDLKDLFFKQVSLLKQMSLIILACIFVESILYYFILSPMLFYMVSQTSVHFFNNTFLILYEQNFLLLSTALFNIFYFYLFFCALLLLFTMIGVVLLLKHNIFPEFNTTLVKKHKILTTFKQSFKSVRISNDL